MKICSVLLFTALATVSAFGQDKAKVAMSPTEVIAGKDITITVTVDQPVLVNGVPISGTLVSGLLTPEEGKDNPGAYGVNLSPKAGDPKVYVNTVSVPISAKGVWSLKSVSINLPGQGGSRPLDTNTPKFTIKPVDVKVPTTGKAEITVP